MKLGDMTLSEMNKSQRDKYCMIPLYETSKIGKFIESELDRGYHVLGAGGGGEGK